MINIDNKSASAEVAAVWKNHIYNNFKVMFHGKALEHKHYIDFLCMNDVAIECKAIASLGVEQRQQLWNYMRLSKTSFGILYNFAPIKDQCEKYHLDTATNVITAF